MPFQREKQSVSASQLLQAIADGEEIKLSQCTITGALDITRLFDPNEKFQTQTLRVKDEENRKTIFLTQTIIFEECVFDENVVFAGPWSDPDSIIVEFEQNVIFNSSHFNGQVRLRCAIFHGSAGFDGCVFNGVVTFRNIVVHKDAKFRTAEFHGYALFGGAQFNASANFTNSHFVKGVNFSNVEFQSHVDFSGVYSSSRAVPTCDGVSFLKKRYGEDENFWRFVKQSAQEAGYYQHAGECFYRERCARLWSKLHGPGYEAVSPFRKMVRQVAGLRLMPELLFGRMLFGYGERPVRVLFASALVILICATFFANPGALEYRGQATTQADSYQFFQGLYFSTITFTTLGYGDLYPSAATAYRVIAMLEAVAGGCLMALFVVCMAKRFSRG